MKAKELVFWFIRQSEQASHLPLCGDTEEDRKDIVELFIGVRPETDIPNGDYMFVYLNDDDDTEYFQTVSEIADYVLCDRRGSICLVRID